MTMTRTDKATHEEVLKGAGRRAIYLDVEFASPTLRARAIADRGHANMTRGEYADKRMGRGTVKPGMVSEVRERLNTISRRQRIIGGRRVTGFLPGTKRPTGWATDGVERCTVRH